MAVGLRYHHSCVNCFGLNTDERNEKGLPCEICLPGEVEPREVLQRLEKNRKLMFYRYIKDFEKNFSDFSSFFKRVTGFPPTGFQRIWMKRVLLSKSFTAIAPTGVGKTTFGMVTSLWFSIHAKRSAMILPTLTLVLQIKERLKEMVKRIDEDIDVIHYHSRMKEKDKKEFFEKLESGDFHIAIFSTQFLSKNREILSKLKFDFVFVDDVDAVLKSSKNIDTILMMLGIEKEAIEKALMKLRKKQEEEFEIGEHGILVVSSATARPRGIRPLLFRELLGFDVGTLIVGVRNITNLRANSENTNDLLNLLKKLKDGIVLLARDEKTIKWLSETVESAGFPVGKSWENLEKALEAFSKGGVSIIAGVYSYYGKLVRGLDLPKRVKFVIFWGTPIFEYFIDIEKAPRFVIRRVLSEVSKKDTKAKKLLQIVDRLDIEALRDRLKDVLSKDEWEETVKRIFGRYRIKERKLLLPDVLTYIQASGRSSRLLGSKLTKGVSILFETDDVVFESLKERLNWLTEEGWIDLEDADWETLLKEVEESRKEEKKEFMDVKSTLLIVESPTKAETISKFFGRSSTRRYKGILVHESITGDGIYLLTATRGHVYDLVMEGGIHGVEVENGKFVPVYETIRKCRKCGYQFSQDLDICPKCGSKDIDNKLDVLKSLREIALEVDEILVATDPDVEGEKISWDVTQYLIPVNSNTRRIEMHEITRYGFREGIASKRDVNSNLVKSQIVRRVQDRWIGFELSKKIQKAFNSFNLSAGRVQSTVLGWIVKREEEYKKSEKTFTKLTLENGYQLEVGGSRKSEIVKVLNIEESIERISPPPPFTTDTILSEASKRFRLGVNEIMKILQDLFERGFITYHRTDSTRISTAGQMMAKSYLESRGKGEIFKGRSWGEGGAHEAIRPVKALDVTDIENLVEERLAEEIGKNHLNVYSMIFSRFMASQSREAVVKKQKVSLEVDSDIVKIEIVSEIVEDGWNLFLPIKVFKAFEKKNYRVVERKIYKKHTIPLYTQATIIEEMKRKGIGRPSTYSKIVETLFARGYIVEDNYRRIRPTQLGKRVSLFLKKRYNRFVTEETTRKLEELMDEIENGEKDHQEALKGFFEELKNIMEEV